MDGDVLCKWIERELERDEHIADYCSGEQYQHEYFDDLAVVSVHVVWWTVPALLVRKWLPLYCERQLQD
jgi:hypothetical protein